MEYIAQDNMDTEGGWVERLFGGFQSLAETPGMGHLCEDLTSIAAYLILYRVQARCVELVAVIQGTRDIPTFLDQRNL